MDSRFVTFLCAALLSCSVEAMQPEDIFADAESYTVRIETRIEQAFGDDSVGVFNGAGFIVDAERGWIVTNKHVVGESPSHVRVATKGGGYVEASKLYVDSYTDIAVIQTDLGKTAESVLECDVMPRTGHPVGAYGHPWGLDYTGTQGVISGRTDKPGVDLLQTDAPINAGNSGGPLISMRSGKIVGISSASYADDDAENTNFAVPISEVCLILKLLKENIDPSPPRIPVAFYNLEDSDELIVARTYLPEGTLDLRPHDRIVNAGSRHSDTKKQHELINALRGESDKVQMTIERGGELLEIRGHLDPQRRRRGVVFAGMVLAEAQLLDSEVFSFGHDIGIHTFLPGSRGLAADLERWWDFIVSVDGNQVENLEHLFQLLSKTVPGEQVELEFVRVLEPPLFNAIVMRTIPADAPVWLEEVGFWNGLRAKLSTEIAGLDDIRELDVTERGEHIDAVKGIIREIESPAEPIPIQVSSELLSTARNTIDRMSRP